MDGGDTGEFGDGLGFGFGFELRAGGRQRAGEGEATEGAVDAAARVDALDDLLTEVAALGEVQGAGLAGLLREVFAADVSADAGRAFEDAEVFEGGGRDGSGSGGDEGGGELLDCGRTRPDSKRGMSGL